MGVPREHLRRWGWVFAAEQAGNPEMRSWRSDDGRASVAYVPARRAPGSHVWVAAGEPFAPADGLHATARAFEADARAAGRGVVWFGASDRLAAGYAGASMVLGAEPVVQPDAWDHTLASKRSLRAQLARARNKGVGVRPVSADWLAGDGGAACREILTEWLATRGMPPLHFLAQPDIFDALGDRRVWIAERASRTVAVLALAPVGARPASLVEWVLRRPDAPNGTAALLIDAAVRAEHARGTREVSLGLVPLSTHAPMSAQRPPFAVRALLRWTRAHARRFYHFDGLERFKAKFKPSRWDPVYLLTPGRAVTLGTLHTVADAFAGPRSPERLVARAVWDAAAEEARRLGPGRG